MALEVPSNNFSSISLIAVVGRLCVCTSFGSIKQWVDPESTRAEKEREELEISSEMRGTRREFGSERADAWSCTTSEVAQGGSTQSSACAEAGGLLSLFLDPGWFPFPFPLFERRGP